LSKAVRSSLPDGFFHRGNLKRFSA
jgi:hypothetical protein